MYDFYNANPLGLNEDDCVIRAISCATNRSWDAVYDELSDLAQAKGTLLDKKDFVRGYLNTHFRRVYDFPYKVYQVAQKYKNNTVICALFNHLVCIKNGRILDTFDCSDRVVEDLWLVK